MLDALQARHSISGVVVGILALIGSVSCSGSSTDPLNASLTLVNRAADSVGVIAIDSATATRVDLNPGPIRVDVFLGTVVAPGAQETLDLQQISGYEVGRSVSLALYRIRSGSATLAHGMNVSSDLLRKQRFRVELNLPSP